MIGTRAPYSVNGDHMHITIPHILASTDERIERLKAELGISNIHVRALSEENERWRLDYAQTLAERDAFSKSYTAAQLQLSAMCERNDELLVLLGRVAAVSVPGPELRNDIKTALGKCHDD